MQVRFFEGRVRIKNRFLCVTENKTIIGRLQAYRGSKLADLHNTA